MPREGPPTVYKPKNPKKRVQGILTDADAKLVEQFRRELAKMTGIKRISDGDVIAYMARCTRDADGGVKECKRLTGK